MRSHRVISQSPPNTGVGVDGLTGEPLTQQQMFVRCNMPPPLTPPSGFELVIPGEEPRFVTLGLLEPYERVTLDIVLECAGNGRTLMNPVPQGVAWELDGVSPIKITGYRLNEVLGALPEDVLEVVFTGADKGTVSTGEQVPYQFSIGKEMAESATPVLVTHIGSEPLTLLHGAPIRLMVPGHYGMKSVKWLTRVEAITNDFRGYFVQRYRFVDDPVEPDDSPVGEISVRSVIGSPADGETIPGGVIEVRGSAWSDGAEVSGVTVSLDGGANWERAKLDRPGTSGAWAAVRWVYTARVEPGELEILARATDANGDIQPLEPRWNLRGYANNVVQRIVVTVTDS